MARNAAQKTLGSLKLRRIFEEKSSEHAEELEDNCVASALRMLSLAVHEMQEAGMEVSLDIRTGDYSNAYDMVFSQAQANASVAAYGFLHIGPMTRLIAIADEVDEVPTTRVYLSEHNTHETESRMEWEKAQTVPCICFNFRQDQDALTDFQTYVAGQAAKYMATIKNDIAGVFNNGQTAITKLDKKPSLGAALKKPQQS